jgi:hypothetical protein
MEWNAKGNGSNKKKQKKHTGREKKKYFSIKVTGHPQPLFCFSQKKKANATTIFFFAY